MDLPTRRRVLDNGLTVVHHADSSAPVVAVYVYYHVGSSREEQGKTGFAHLFEHMLFQGSAHVSENGHFQQIQAAGGTLNGTTNQDRTNYYETLSSEHLDLALFLESDRMGHLLPAMTQAKLDNQRDVVMNERRQSYENRPYGLVYETVLGALYPAGHPYSWPTIGSMADIEGATLEDVDAFFRRWYGPNNATLVIAGDVEAEHAFDRAAHWFGAIERGPGVVTPAPRPAGLSETRRLVLEDRVQLPQLTLTWPTVPAWHPDEQALNLLADVLSANGSSILDRVLLNEEESASSVTISHAPGERAGGLTIQLRPSEGHTLGELERRVDELIGEVVERGVDPERLERLKNRLEGATLRGLESVSARAGLLGHYQCFRGEVDLLARSLERHRAVQADALVDVAQRYLVERPRVVLSTVPEGQRDLAAGERDGARITLPVDADRSASPAPSEATAFSLPAVDDCGGSQRFRGLMDETLPLVHVSLTLPGGRFLERPEEAGRAGLTAALLEEGTASIPSAEVPDTLDGLGAVFAAGAGLEGVRLRLTTLRSTLEPALAFLREVLGAPRFGQADVERLVRQAQLGIRTRRDRPAELADDRLRALVFGDDDARGRPARGRTAALDGFAAADVRSLWERLSSGAPRLSVVGAAGVEEVRAGLGLDGARAEQDAALAVADPSPRPSLQLHLIDKPGAQQSELRVGHVAIPRDHPDYDPLMAVNHVLGGSFSSRINLNLREDKGWTYGARSGFDGGHAAGAFQVATAVETSVTAAALEEILRELERVPEGFTQEEAGFAAASLSQSLRRAYASTASRLAYLDNLTTYGFAPDYPEHRLEALASMTAADLERAASAHLRSRPEDLAVVVVGDGSRIRGDLEALGRGAVVED